MKLSLVSPLSLLSLLRLRSSRSLQSLLATLAFVGVAASAAGCHSNARLQAPDDFAELGAGKSKTYDWRAASAHGVVLAVRTEANEPRANVEFWADAIDVRMREGGYAAEAKKNVVSASGLQGKQLRYSREDDRRVYRYWLTVFATGDRVYVIEAGGDKESFDPAEKIVERAVLSLRAS
jgi:hypothetical protein